MELFPELKESRILRPTTLATHSRHLSMRAERRPPWDAIGYTAIYWVGDAQRSHNNWNMLLLQLTGLFI